MHQPQDRPMQTNTGLMFFCFSLKLLRIETISCKQAGLSLHRSFQRTVCGLDRGAPAVTVPAGTSACGTGCIQGRYNHTAQAAVTARPLRGPAHEHGAGTALCCRELQNPQDGLRCPSAWHRSREHGRRRGRWLVRVPSTSSPAI